MKNRSTRILLVEDDPHLSELIRDFLELEGYEVILARDGEEGLTQFFRNKSDLCLVDVMMPVKDGFCMVEELRKTDKEVPVIFITARSMQEDRIRGFKIGCDDYLTKPFNKEELLLRIQAVLKRCLANIDEARLVKMETFNVGNYVFDYSNMTLSFKGDKQNLTRKEADLLRLLVINKNQLLKRDMALKIVWGEDDYFIGRSMDVFITKLRKYLRADPRITISNVHGTGFRLEVDD